MDQHPMPRQITTFEFKLIGFMTLKQFIYLVIFVPVGFIVFSLLPIPILNIFAGLCVVGFGFALAFLPIHERPLDIWIKNLFRRLTSPTQYLYHKKNEPVYFFKNLFFVTDPHIAVAHVESQEKLNEYLSKTQKVDAIEDKQSQGIKRVNQVLQSFHITKKETEAETETKTGGAQTIGQTTQPSIATSSIRQAALVGVVKNNKKIPLPGVLIYIKDAKDTPIRLLKTNPHGIFATYSRLNPGQYTVEIKDPKGSFVFDTMKINVAGESQTPLEFYSKELL